MSELLVRRDGELLLLTLNRPEKANAINEAINNALVAQLHEAAADEDVRAVVLAGSGTRCFSAGADLKEFADLERTEASRRRRALLVRTLEAFIGFPKPLVAAVQAKALGAGCMLALLADEAIAAEAAEFGMPEIKHGMRSPIGYVIVAARGGHAAARCLIQGGESIGARSAQAWHLVDEVVPTQTVNERALARARALARHAGSAFESNKEFMSRGLREQFAAARRTADAT